MTTTELDLVACQLGDCRNRAALTVTVELPTSWTESREYTTRTLLVAVCGDCAAALEADAKALLEARSRFARRRSPSDAPSGRRTSNRPLSIEDARFRRRALEPSDRPPLSPSSPVPFRPRGGDDVA